MTADNELAVVSGGSFFTPELLLPERRKAELEQRLKHFILVLSNLEQIKCGEKEKAKIKGKIEKCEEKLYPGI